MSVIAPYDVRRAVRESRTNDRTAQPAGEPLAVDEFVAGVLGQAHQAAYEQGTPDEARAILRLAHVFADELAKTNPRFDRLRFIEATMEEPV